jgi:O-antigen ligase
VSTSAIFQGIAEVILGYFGKDLTLTGRTEIWPLVIDKIIERPFIGYGFRGFWHHIDGESAYIVRALRWGVPDSHNGFLDLTLSLGLLGLSLFLVIYWTTLIRSISVVAKDNKGENLWPIAFMFYLVIVNFSESSLLSEGSFVWAMLVATSLSISVEFKYLFSRPKTNH